LNIFFIKISFVSESLLANFVSVLDKVHSIICQHDCNSKGNNNDLLFHDKIRNLIRIFEHTNKPNLTIGQTSR